jgi:hypothetical protein
LLKYWISTILLKEKIIMSITITGLTMSGALTAHNTTQAPSNFTAEYLVVAGGGGGSAALSQNWEGAGGGAGGMLSGTSTITVGTTYSVTVGAGGAGGYYNVWDGVNGDDSSISTIAVATGGGGGGANANPGHNGGSGGGSWSGAAGTGIAGQGYNGSNGHYNQAGGGAGSAVGVYQGFGQHTGDQGGDGLSNSITGSSVIYAVGGCGATAAASVGGGGAGGYSNYLGVGDYVGADGTAHTGGGGGGGASATNGHGGAGGSGVVVIRIPTAYYSGRVTGSPVVTTVGSDTVIQFNASGTYTV